MGITQTKSVHLLILWRKLRAIFCEWIQELSLKTICFYSQINNLSTFLLKNNYLSSYQTFGEWRSFARKRLLEICNARSSLGRDSSEPRFKNYATRIKIVDSKKTLRKGRVFF